MELNAAPSNQPSHTAIMHKITEPRMFNAGGR